MFVGRTILGNRVFYVVAADALPEVFKKVITAKELLENGEAKNISTAIKACDLSRSAFYKYKDSVFRAASNSTNELKLKAVLIDRAGVLSAFSNALFKSGANVITMNQAAPKEGLAYVSVVIGTDNIVAPISEFIKNLEHISGVISIKQYE